MKFGLGFWVFPARPTDAAVDLEYRRRSAFETDAERKDVQTVNPAERYWPEGGFDKEARSCCEKEFCVRHRAWQPPSTGEAIYNAVRMGKN